MLGRKLVIRYRPLGVVGVIGPWNYPLTNSFGDCIPALAAGNAVVLKPSEVTPLTSLLMAEAHARVRAARGRAASSPRATAATGAALIDEVDMVMFTGSTATGKKIMERAAETLTPVSLELGGKDPMIVLADADLERAADAAAYYSMQNGGQTCISVERVYVEAPVYDEFVDKVTRKVAALRQGASSGPGTVDVGAITFPPQLDIVSRHVEQARAAGARVLTGGTRARGRRPLLRADRARRRRPLDGVHDRGDVRADGPDHEGRATPTRRCALANDSEYGLAASVWTKDAARGEAIARRVEAGVGVRQRRPDQLPRARAADGRLEGVGPRLAPRRGRDPQVLPPAVAAGHALRAAQGRPPLLSVPRRARRS